MKLLPQNYSVVEYRARAKNQYAIFYKKFFIFFSFKDKFHN